MNLTVIDDSGLLAVVDIASYRSFVSSDWDYSSILAHFREQMAAGTIFVWDCGDGGGDYPVSLQEGISASEGFREAWGVLRVQSGAIHLVSYDALTMAAQFSDEVLPAVREKGQRMALAPGTYRVRVVQRYDPAGLERPPEGDAHFLIEFEQGAGSQSNDVAWLPTDE